MATTSSAVKQLLRDFDQLQKEPIIGATAVPDEKNIKIWYALVAGVDGTAYEGVPIRFTMEFPDDYPNSPPKAFFDTDIKYEGGASYRDESGRLVVCLNIFGNFGMVHDEWKNQQAGWSPAYTVSTILITMQGMMMADMLSNNERDIESTKNSARNFKCNATGHDGSDQSKWYPKPIMTQEELELYLIEKGIEKKVHIYDPFKDNYICYVKKQSYADGAILGYGVNIDNPKNGMLSSPCEYLSKIAFNEGTRRSSTNKQFEYWLPIIIKQSDWQTVRPFFAKTVIAIGSKIGYDQNRTSEAIIKIISSIMNSLVVEIMNNKNNLSANDKFVDGYFAFYRLLKQCASEDPKIVQFVDGELKKFVNDPYSRTKTNFPNLGELLIYLSISKRWTWEQVAGSFIKECDTRNVFWYAVGNYNNPARYPELLNTNIINGRDTKVFDATSTSRNLVAFQARFSSVARNIDESVFESNYGLAPNDIRTEMKKLYEKINSIANWNEYFKWLHMKQITSEERCAQLVEAVKSSERSGYHKAGAPPARRNYNNW